MEETKAHRETAAELDAATIGDPRLRHAYSVCGRWLNDRHSSAPHAWLRSHMPLAARPYWDALLAFCGYADDLADDPRVGPAHRRRQYDRFVEGFFQMLDDQHEPLPSPPRHDVGLALCLAFRDLVRTWDIGEDSLRVAHRAVRDDIGVSMYHSEAELERYLNGSCAQPNLWLSTVLGLTEDGNTQGARAWGLGIGLVDCLLDLEEDLRIGKLYFPLDDLRRCRVGPADIERAVSARCVTEPLRRLISLQVSRAVRHFATAEDWARQCRAQEGEIVLQSIARARQAIDCIAHTEKSIFAMSDQKAT